jgi:hypothetical protein
VLLVGREHEAAGLGVLATHVGQTRVGVPQHLAHPVAVRIERRPQTARGLGARQDIVEARAAQAAVALPLHLAVVWKEGDRAADAVHEGLGVAVGVVRTADAVVVVAHPWDRGAVGSERRAGEQQPELGTLERLARPDAPGGVVAHVVRLVRDQQGRAAIGHPRVPSRARRDRLVGHGDAVAVARLGAVGVRAVRLEVDPVSGGVGCPLPADVRGRSRHHHTRHAPAREHLARHVQPERGLASRRGRRGEEARPLMPRESASGHALPRPQRAVGGPGRQRPAAGEDCGGF